MKYEITSDRFGPLGAIVTDKDLAGCNVQALVAAGHVKAVRPKQPGQMATTTRETD